MERAIDLRANGKLLLTGEYLVLKGATALALPVRFGQHMHIEPLPGSVVRWRAEEPAGCWFEATLDPSGFTVLSTSCETIALRLSELLGAAHRLNPRFPGEPSGVSVTTSTNYPVNWGLGSSSTLIYLVARWAGVDPFALHQQVSEGSGYDIACASRNRPLFYTMGPGGPSVEEAIPGKALSAYALFAWLGRKQETRSEVAQFLGAKAVPDPLIQRISHLSRLIAGAASAGDLCSLVEEHETLLGEVLRRDPLSARFPSFPGAMKSLGAWGGDFAMFVSPDPDLAGSYLKAHKITDIFTFEELMTEP